MKKLAMIVEDDKILSDGIKNILSGLNIGIYQAYTVADAKKIFENSRINIIILDINLPDENGLELCVFCKKHYPQCSVIIVSALDLDIDVIRGLELGADDYITKPFNMLVFRARVQVALRKLVTKGESIVFGEYLFDFTHMEFQKNNNKIHLSITEQKVLKLLINNRNQIVTIDKFLDEVWDCNGEFVDKHALTVTIKRLREKLEDSASKASNIKNVYGIGYMWKSEEYES